MTTTSSTSRDGILIESAEGILTVTFNRPEQRNAMTWSMYEGLMEACEMTSDDAVRVMVLRGAGDRAFVAGTDVAQFETFDGPKGIDYEKQISHVLERLRAVDVPVIAAIEGYCVGGGIGIAASADIRVCSSASTFGVPIARTLGNCLSADTLSLLISLLGRSRAVDMLLQARFLSAEEAHTAGFVSQITDDPDTTANDIARRLLAHAPLTMWSVKEGVRRLNDRPAVDDDDIVDRIYGSDDFHNAVKSFLAKTEYTWSGR